MERLARGRIRQTTDLQKIQISPRLVRTVDGMPVPQAAPMKLGQAEWQSLHQALGDSALVNLMLNAIALVSTPDGTAQHAAQVQGLLAPDPALADSTLAAGRYFSYEEGMSGAPVVTISDRLASDFARGGPPTKLVGDTLIFQGQRLRVIGVMRAAERDQVRRAIVPWGAVAQFAAGPLERPSQLLVSVPTIEAVAPTRSAVERWAAGLRGSSWKDDLSIVSDEARLEEVQRGLLLFKVFMGALMSISLIVGGIGIMNVLLASVIERTREIGIRRAAGAARRDIFRQFLAESVVITGVGSLMGLLIGVGSAFGVTAIMRRVSTMSIHAWLSPSTVLVAVGASVVVGLSFGVYPALRASRLSPIDAIHHE
jgi:putative ABC transport system permease protein